MSDTPAENPFGDLSGLFGQQPGSGPVNWEVARQVAMAVGSGGVPEPSPSPSEVAAFEAIVRAAELALDRAGALEHEGMLGVQVKARGAWAADCVDNLRPLLERLAGRLGMMGAGGMAGGVAGMGESGAVPPEAMELAGAMEAILKPLAPILTGLQMGLVLGFVATRAMGHYDLCLPRAETTTVSVIGRNLDEVAGEIGVAADEMRMWVAMHEIAHAAQFSLPWARERLRGLLEAYVDSISFDLAGLQERLQGIDPQNPESLQRVAESADGLLGQFISTDQPDVLESVHTFMSTLEGYADHVVGAAATGLLPDGGRIMEGLGSRSRESGQGDRLLEGLLGLQLTEDRIEEGRDFCAAVVARTDMATLNRMWESIDTFPTREELQRPDEWIRRMATTPRGGIFGA